MERSHALFLSFYSSLRLCGSVANPRDPQYQIDRLRNRKVKSGLLLTPHF